MPRHDLRQPRAGRSYLLASASAESGYPRVFISPSMNAPPVISRGYFDLPDDDDDDEDVPESVIPPQSIAQPSSRPLGNETDRTAPYRDRGASPTAHEATTNVTGAQTAFAPGDNFLRNKIGDPVYSESFLQGYSGDTDIEAARAKREGEIAAISSPAAASMVRKWSRMPGSESAFSVLDEMSPQEKEAVSQEYLARKHSELQDALDREKKDRTFDARSSATPVILRPDGKYALTGWDNVRRESGPVTGKEVRGIPDVIVDEEGNHLSPDDPDYEDGFRVKGWYEPWQVEKSIRRQKISRKRKAEQIARNGGLTDSQRRRIERRRSVLLRARRRGTITEGELQRRIGEMVERYRGLNESDEIPVTEVSSLERSIGGGFTARSRKEAKKALQEKFSEGSEGREIVQEVLSHSSPRRTLLGREYRQDEYNPEDYSLTDTIDALSDGDLDFSRLSPERAEKVRSTLRDFILYKAASSEDDLPEDMMDLIASGAEIHRDEDIDKWLRSLVQYSRDRKERASDLRKRAWGGLTP